MRIINLSDASARETIREMREKLSVSAGAVTPDSREKTIEAFGEPLSPLESVRRIVDDVRSHGDEAVFRYAKLLDGSELNE